jgi:branched-chain amino acid transport system ATP-binding protein
VSDAILDIQYLCAGYGQSQVLFNMELQAPRRGGIAVLGRNGTGKTTLLKTIAGELVATQGTILFNGKEARDLPTERRALAGIGYVPQEQAVFAKLTVRENLEIGAIRKKDRSGIERVLTIFPKLRQRLSQQAGTLSGGERKMLAIGRALLGEPKLLMLDEPSEGLWIGVIEEIVGLLIELSRSIGVIIVEQHVELALRVASFAYVMDRGHVALCGSAESIRDDPRLLRYLTP